MKHHTEPDNSSPINVQNIVGNQSEKSLFILNSETPNSVPTLYKLFFGCVIVIGSRVHPFKLQHRRVPNVTRPCPLYTTL